MIRRGWIAGALLAAGLLAGCTQATPGTTRMLGSVEYDVAFAAASDVLADYFSVAQTDADRGLIRSRPVPLAEQQDRILGGSPGRQVATMRIRRNEGQVAAQLAVAIERQGAAVHRRFGLAPENYDQVPHQTPAEEEGATTPVQNEAWEIYRYDKAMERKILDQLYRRLHPPEGK